jgi:hypothetical protein
LNASVLHATSSSAVDTLCLTLLQTLWQTGLTAPDSIGSEVSQTSHTAVEALAQWYLRFARAQRTVERGRGPALLLGVITAPSGGLLALVLPMTWEGGPSSVPDMLAADPEVTLRLLGRQALFVTIRVMAYSNAAYLGAAVDAMTRHAGDGHVAESGILFLSNLAYFAANKVPLMAHVGVAVDTIIMSR